MATLTNEQRALYIAQGGVCCPFCMSTDIEGGSVEIEEGRAIQGIACSECEEEWVDVYTLVGINH